MRRHSRLGCLFALAVAACVLASVITARAEPGPVVDYLMSASVSQFSFGMYRINEDLDKIEGETRTAIFAFYDWDKNRIKISATRFGDDPKQTAEDCKPIMQRIRVSGGVDENGKFLLGESANSWFADNFGPIGYERKDAPENFLHKIDDIIDIEINLWSSGKHILCSGELVSNKMAVEQ